MLLYPMAFRFFVGLLAKSLFFSVPRRCFSPQSDFSFSPALNFLL
jgi:hypothetical protein